MKINLKNKFEGLIVFADALTGWQRYDPHYHNTSRMKLSFGKARDRDAPTILTMDEADGLLLSIAKNFIRPSRLAEQKVETYKDIDTLALDAGIENPLKRGEGFAPRYAARFYEERMTMLMSLTHFLVPCTLEGGPEYPCYTYAFLMGNGIGCNPREAVAQAIDDFGTKNVPAPFPSWGGMMSYGFERYWFYYENEGPTAIYEAWATLNAPVAWYYSVPYIAKGGKVPLEVGYVNGCQLANGEWQYRYDAKTSITGHNVYYYDDNVDGEEYIVEKRGAEIQVFGSIPELTLAMPDLEDIPAYLPDIPPAGLKDGDAHIVDYRAGASKQFVLFAVLDMSNLIADFEPEYECLAQL